MQTPESGLEFKVPGHQKPETEQKQAEHSENLVEIQPQHPGQSETAKAATVSNGQEQVLAQAAAPLEGILEPGALEAQAGSAADNEAFAKRVEHFLSTGDFADLNEATYGQSQNPDQAA